jgi:dual specificity protein kinase YAK1
MKTNEIVAVKVVKNKPAYFNQSMMEVAILDEVRLQTST